MMLMRMRMRDERGVAMVVALLVSFVLLLLATAIVAQSIHNVDSSALDRRRLQSINAAEAGNNYYYAYLQSTQVTSLSCAPVTQTIASAPATASFTATPTYFDASGNAMSCPSSTPFTSTSYPSAVSIQTTGSVSGQTPRTMQTYIRLNPVYGGFGAAILVNSTASFVNNFNIYGNTSYDGDIYVLNGNFTIGNSGHVRGNVYVPNGGASMSNSSLIEGDLWVRDNITMSNSARVNGNAISSTGSISGANLASVGLNATASTTISGVAVGGTQYPNTVSPQPPTQPFPQIGYVLTDWTNAGYTNIQTFTGASACTNARDYVTGTFSSTPSIGNTVVRITGVTGGCTLTFTNLTNVTVNANLAIITDYGITMENQSNWNASGTVKDVHFISTWPAPNPCPSGTASKSVITANNTSMNDLVHAFFYSPCLASMSNSSNWHGQVIGGQVSIANNFAMTYEPVLVPGVGQVQSFTEDIAYVREVANP